MHLVIYLHTFWLFGKKWPWWERYDKSSRIKQTAVHMYSYFSGKVAKWEIFLSKFGESDFCVCQQAKKRGVGEACRTTYKKWILYCTISSIKNVFLISRISLNKTSEFHIKETTEKKRCIFSFSPQLSTCAYKMYKVSEQNEQIMFFHLWNPLTVHLK